MERRGFVKNISLGSLALGISLDALLVSCGNRSEDPDDFKRLVLELLKEWCDGMLNSQVTDPDDLSVHGSLDCPACDHIHGRCMDAVYPFLHMADHTGDRKYLEAAILVMEWAENNVSQEDGSWTVIPDPKSWRGITVFGAIALAEALHYHGHILDKSMYNRWEDRLGRAAEYVYQKFNLTFTNINYGATAIYGLYLCGKVLNKQEYIDRSHELARGIAHFFTENDGFLFGEGSPGDKRSEKGLHVIDLGYNVEESLSNLVLYAVETRSEELTSLLVKSLQTHLEFMLPDGGWDNSWGTRQYKWTYWGSRTCDGSQLTYAFLSDQDPAFSKAVKKNTHLLKDCTHNGLLHGGPHYVSHGIKPCIHHTFEHAKPLATLLNNLDRLKHLHTDALLPREKEYGFRYFSDIDTVLLSRGPWRGTVTAYDAIYKKGDYRQATGGALSVLYHNRVGLLFAASMAKYKLAEKNNQQPNPGPEFALTPRIETMLGQQWYTNLYDLTAIIEPGEKEGIAYCTAKAVLKNEGQEMASGTASAFILNYECHAEKFMITAQPLQPVVSRTTLVLPLISKNDEHIQRISENRIMVQKSGGKVIIEANVPMNLTLPGDQRIFNMVPGVEAAPVIAEFKQNKMDLIEIKIYVEH